MTLICRDARHHRLEAEIERLHEAARVRMHLVNETAAFLDRMAKRLETCVGIITNDPECPCQDNADDCRAMAAKLRGET
jgi:hypothetical protein